MHPRVKIKVYAKGTGAGIKDLIDKKATIAMISRDASPEENKGILWKLAVARDGVGLIINAKNPWLKEILARGFTQAELVKIFTSEKPLNWNYFIKTASSKQISTYNRSDNSGAAEVWANFLFCTQADLKGKGCEGDPAMINNIAKDIFGLGFCNLNFAFDDKTRERITEIEIVPIDLNNNGKVDKKEEIANNLFDFERNVWAGRYPKCLCRYLYLATIEKPVDHTVIEFLKFTQDQGQEIVASSGLCKLNTIEIENNNLLLK
jgi:phosphate transport system substrate-binding protein